MITALTKPFNQPTSGACRTTAPNQAKYTPEAYFAFARGSVERLWSCSTYDFITEIYAFILVWEEHKHPTRIINCCDTDVE